MMLPPAVEEGAWTTSAELREVPAGQPRFAPDSPLYGRRYWRDQSTPKGCHRDWGLPPAGGL